MARLQTAAGCNFKYAYKRAGFILSSYFEQEEGYLQSVELLL